MKKSMRMVAAITCLGALAGSTGVGERSAVAAKVQIVSANMPIKILYNARQLTTDVQPDNISGSVIVPIRFISDKMGAKITLSGNRISIVKSAKKLELVVGATTATVNGKTMKLNVPVRITNGRTLVPLRVISEGLGLPVEWDSVNQFVWIGSKDVPELKNVVKTVDFKEFKDYYKNAPDYLLNGGFGVYTNATVVTAGDFPFIIGANTYYRLDLAFDQNKNAFFQTIEKTQATINSAYYFLSRKTTPTISNQLLYLMQIPVKGTHIYFNDIAQLGGLDALHKVDYIDFRNVIQFGNGKSSTVLIQNPWR